MLPLRLTRTASRLWREDEKAHAKLIASASHPLQADAAAWSVWSWASGRRHEHGALVQDRLIWAALASSVGLACAKASGLDGAILVWRRRSSLAAEALRVAPAATRPPRPWPGIGAAPDQAWLQA